jgi:hypothetical protein
MQVPLCILYNILNSQMKKFRFRVSQRFKKSHIAQR